MWVIDYLRRPDVASVSSGDRSILLRRREDGEEDAGTTPVAACLGPMFCAVGPGSTMPFTGEKLPNGDPNMPMMGLPGLIGCAGLYASLEENNGATRAMVDRLQRKSAFKHQASHNHQSCTIK